MSTADETLETIKAQVESETPDDITIASVSFEGPELVIYTPEAKEVATRDGIVRNLAQTLRKRINVRPTQDALVPQAEAESIIEDTIPEDAGVQNLDFDGDTGEVFVEAEKPGRVIGRHGETLDQISASVGWTPEVVRTPPMESNTVSNVRNFLKQERNERRDILERVGRQINRPETADDDWVRRTTLGCCR